MWVKIDDGFASHPKILKAGPMALVLQIRAICYASVHKTDGFLDRAITDFLTRDLEPLLSHCSWPDYMVMHGLWDEDPDNRCYRIHHYLQWNISKEAFSVIKKKKSDAGKKGMKSRWNKEKSIITDVITGVDNTTITPLSISIVTSLPLSSRSGGEKIVKKRGEVEFEQFWAAYPRKVGKKAALKAWMAATDQPPLPEILAAVGRGARSAKWQEEHGTYIPNPATWLNQGRWDDVLPAKPMTTMEAFLAKGDTDDTRRVRPGLVTLNHATVGQGVPDADNDPCGHRADPR